MRSDNTPSNSPEETFRYFPPKVQRTSSSSFRLTNSIVVGSKLDVVFEFCRDTRFLNEISPPLLHFEPLNKPEVDAKIAAGIEIEYDMRLHGIPVRWRSRIPVYEPPHRFVDEQISGPYVFWSHTHTFKPIDDHNTVIGDVVNYTLPGGPILASLAQLLFVKRDLSKVFAHRSMKYRDFLGAPALSLPR